MRNIGSVGVVGAVLGATLGVGALGCGGSTATTSSSHDDGGATSSGHPSGSGSTSNGSSTSTHVSGSTSGHSSAKASYLPCESPMPVEVAGENTGFVQCAGNVVHRASVVACPTTQPPLDGGACPLGERDASSFAGECNTNKDCTAQPLGSCSVPGGGGLAIGCSCSYGCSKDSDCASGSICQCGHPVGTCIPATCTSDSDCPTGSLCASNAAAVGSCSPSNFSCQSTHDACFSTDDCSAMHNGSACVESPTDAGAARTCSFAACAGGRPFLVDDVARVAGVVAQRDWCGTVTRAASRGLGDVTRAALAGHWTRVAQMEHASVAAFARFAMELLALGAPPDLLIGCSEAMADETEHARLTFALASGYAGDTLGPAPLDVSGALRVPDARSVFATLVREGCIGETLAAVEATEGHAQATDVAVKSALATIAADETSHAALAFQAARWMFERGDAAFRSWADEEMLRAVSERRGMPRLESPVCPEHGLLGAAELEALAEQALGTLVLPCWREIVVQTARVDASDPRQSPLDRGRSTAALRS